MPFQLSCCVRMLQLRNSLPSSVPLVDSDAEHLKLARRLKGHNYFVRVRTYVRLDLFPQTLMSWKYFSNSTSALLLLLRLRGLFPKCQSLLWIVTQFLTFHPFLQGSTHYSDLFTILYSSVISKCLLHFESDILGSIYDLASNQFLKKYQRTVFSSLLFYYFLTFSIL